MKQIIATTLLLCTLILTGCFEVVEEISLNDDGSGQITMTVNISRSKVKLNSIMLMDSINNYKVPSREDIRTNINKMVTEISSINGVSNVSKSIDFDDFIFTVSCDFTNVDVLNSVITHFSTEGHKQELTDNAQFSYDASRKVFRRNYHYNLAQEIEKVKQADRAVLDEATVTTIYRFESPILESENPHAKIAGSQKAVMLRVGASDMISNTKNIKNALKLK